MKWHKVNLNDHVRVKLTEVGLEVHRKIHDEQNAQIKSFAPKFVPSEYVPPRKGRGGWYEFQLWQLMNIFGPSMYNGCRPPMLLDVKIEIDGGSR